MNKQRYYFEKILGLFWTHVRMTPEDYLQGYNKFRETLQIVPKVSSSENHQKIIIECDFFEMKFYEFSENHCKCSVLLKDTFEHLLPNTLMEKLSFLSLEECIEEYIEKECVIELIKYLDVLTGVSLSINTHGDILVEKIRCLLEFIIDLNKSLKNNGSVGDDIRDEIL